MDKFIIRALLFLSLGFMIGLSVSDVIITERAYKKRLTPKIQISVENGKTDTLFIYQINE